MLKNTNMNKIRLTHLNSISIPDAGRAGWRSCGLLGVALVTGLLLSGCKPAEPADDVPTVTVQVGAAEKEPIQRKVIADATLYPRDQAAIVPKVSSPVSKFFVDRGGHVHAGEVLAELENQDLAGAHAKSQGGTQQAEAAYEVAVQKAAQDLALAKQTLDGAQKLYDSRQALYKQGAVSAKDAEDAGIALTQAKNQYDLTQKQGDLKVAAAQLAAAKGDTANAAAMLSYTQIKSPINGVVTDRPFFPGETAPTGVPLLTVMDLSQVVARAHISQGDAARLKAGDPATIYVPGQSPDVKGKVTLVSPALDPNSTTVEVWVQAANPGERLKAGTSARVTMIGETVQNAIVAPAAALLTSTDGVTSMIVLDTDNKPHKQKVKVGIRSGEDVQITDGLQGGERVVTVGAFELDKEDDPVLAKTKILVQAPKMPDEEE
jgi:RND family efflux transporter MFP subunit